MNKKEQKVVNKVLEEKTDPWDKFFSQNEETMNRIDKLLKKLETNNGNAKQYLITAIDELAQLGYNACGNISNWERFMLLKKIDSKASEIQRYILESF